MNFKSILILLLLSSNIVFANDKNIKFYNFDELLINGNYRKPQVLYTDTKQKIKFKRLLTLKKPLLYKIKETNKNKMSLFKLCIQMLIIIILILNENDYYLQVKNDYDEK